MMHLGYFSNPLVPNGDLKISSFGQFSQFFLVFFFAVYVALTREHFCTTHFIYCNKPIEPFSLNLSYIVTQISMMQLIYFLFPLVPNGGLKIGYFGPFSQFLTLFL